MSYKRICIEYWVPCYLIRKALKPSHQELPNSIADSILATFWSRYYRIFSRPCQPLTVLNLANPRARLSLISRHLEQRPVLKINTPFSTERLSGHQDDLEYTPPIREPPKMDSQKDKNLSKQPEHPALLIPGPVEFDDAVLEAMGHYRCGMRLYTSSIH